MTGAVSGKVDVVYGIEVASAGRMTDEAAVESRLAAKEVDDGVTVSDTAAKALDGK